MNRNLTDSSSPLPVGLEGIETSQEDAQIRDGIVALDKDLLEKVRTQWQFGDWETLTTITHEQLQHHPDKAKIALLVSAGHGQSGNTDSARRFARLAEDWGCSRQLVARVLVSGVYNSLGRAAAIALQTARALAHFESSIAVGSPSSDTRLITEARISCQILSLGFMPSTFGLASWTRAPVLKNRSNFETVFLKQIDLGEAWAGNTINTVIFRHHGILTFGDFQYTAFYVNQSTLRIVRRNLVTEELVKHDIAGSYNLRDAHNSISLGVDRTGHLHMSYDHHASKLRYRRSLYPEHIHDWTDELHMTGDQEEKVTYPTFILPRKNFPLTFLYRDGSATKGIARIKTYDEESQTWRNHPQTILSGAEQKPWTSNAYWNHPVVGSDGSLHLSFVWRTHTLGDEKKVNNINVCYACSYDNGLSWVTSRNRPYKLPITQVNAETIFPVSPGSNLSNQTSMALDSRNRPHIVFYSDDHNGIPQYQHVWFDGKVWHHQIVSNRTQPFSLQGGGTLRIAISRPDILIDDQDTVYVIARGDFSQDRMAATRLSPPHYTFNPQNVRILFSEPLGLSEPVVDRLRWQREKVLSMLVQHNDQPNHDVFHKSFMQPVRLLDLTVI